MYKINLYDIEANTAKKDYTKSNYTLGAAFVLNELVELKPISLVKLRASYSSTNSVNVAGYPVMVQDTPWNKSNPYAVHSMEVGGDFFVAKPALK